VVTHPGIFLAVRVCITIEDEYMKMHPQSVSLVMYSLAVISHHEISSEHVDVATILRMYTHAYEPLRYLYMQ